MRQRVSQMGHAHGEVLRADVAVVVTVKHLAQVRTHERQPSRPGSAGCGRGTRPQAASEGTHDGAVTCRACGTRTSNAFRWDTPKRSMDRMRVLISAASAAASLNSDRGRFSASSSPSSAPQGSLAPGPSGDSTLSPGDGA